MDGEWVSGLLSENGGGGGNTPVANLTYTEIFNKTLPYYLSIGMTADEFWHGEVELAVAYREAYKLKRKEDNFNLWLQGKYIYDALCCASPLFRSFVKGRVQAREYTEHPYELFKEEKVEYEKQKQQKMINDMKAKMLTINANRHKNRQG